MLVLKTICVFFLLQNGNFYLFGADSVPAHGCQIGISISTLRVAGIADGSSWSSALLSQHHCGETVMIIAFTIIQDGGHRRRWVRAGSIVVLVRNTVLSYLYTIQGCHRSWFCVSCFVSLCICFWNMGLWNFLDMIVTYKPDISDMIVTVHGVWS